MKTETTIGFVGLGVMGEPICANMQKAGLGRMRVVDINPDPVARLVALGAEKANGLAELAAKCDIIFLSLPGGAELEAVMMGPDGLLDNGHQGQIIVDMSTAPVALTRDIYNRAGALGIRFADAPVARTRQAAIDGNLSIMVGADQALFDEIRPYLAAAATDITRCGDIGAGQIVKLMNNMVLFQNVVALSEAMITAERSGVPREILLDAMSKGSSDSSRSTIMAAKPCCQGISPLTPLPPTMRSRISVMRWNWRQMPGLRHPRPIWQNPCLSGPAPPGSEKSISRF